MVRGQFDLSGVVSGQLTFHGVVSGQVTSPARS